MKSYSRPRGEGARVLQRRKNCKARGTKGKSYCNEKGYRRIKPESRGAAPRTNPCSKEGKVAGTTKRNQREKERLQQTHEKGSLVLGTTQLDWGGGSEIREKRNLLESSGGQVIVGRKDIRRDSHTKTEKNIMRILPIERGA